MYLLRPLFKQTNHSCTTQNGCTHTAHTHTRCSHSDWFIPTPFSCPFFLSFLLSLLLVLSSCPFFLSLLTHPFFSPSCPLLPHGTFHVSSFGQHKTNTKACVLLPQTCLASKKNKQKEKVQTTTTKVDKRRQIPDMRLKPFQIFGWHEFCVGCPPCFSTAGKLNEVKIGRALLVCVAAQSLNRR